MKLNASTDFSQGLITRLSPLLVLRDFARRDWANMVERAQPPRRPDELTFSPAKLETTGPFAVTLGCVRTEYTSGEDFLERVNCRCTR